MLCVFNQPIAAAIDSADVISSLTIKRLDPEALGRADRDSDLDGSRTVAITVVFGVDRYVATSPLPRPVG